MHTAPAGTLRHDWAPQGFIVSFKLETDSSILRKKAEDSLDKCVQGLLGPLFGGRPQHVHIMAWRIVTPVPLAMDAPFACECGAIHALCVGAGTACTRWWPTSCPV